MRKKMCIHKLSIKSLPDRGPRLTSVATSSNKCFHYNLTAIGEPIKEIKFVVEYYKIGQAKVYGFLALPNRVRSTGKYLVQGDQVPAWWSTTRGVRPVSMASWPCPIEYEAQASI